MVTRTNELGQPIGEPVERMDASSVASARADAGTALPPRTARCRDHAAALHDAFTADTEGRNWTYLPYGPFTSADEYTSWVAEKQAADDPQFHAILVEDAPVGVASYLRIDPTMGVIEVGHI